MRQFNGIKMTQDEMTVFIEKIGRSELYDDIEEHMTVSPSGIIKWDGVCRYLKAVRASLIALGFDMTWVETTFRDAVEARYIPKSK